MTTRKPDIQIREHKKKWWEKREREDKESEGGGGGEGRGKIIKGMWTLALGGDIGGPTIPERRKTESGIPPGRPEKKKGPYHHF